MTTTLDPIVVPEEPVKITPDEVKDEPFSIDVPPEETSAPVSSEISEKRAFKFKYGLDAILKKTKEEIFDTISRGEENSLRLQAADEIDKRKREQTEKVISQVMGAKGGPLTPEETFGIVQIVSNLNDKTDPASVLEEAYGKQFMATVDTMAASRPDSAVAKVKQTNPAILASIQEPHQDIITKREYAEKVAEDLDAEVKNQGWGGYLFDMAKTAVPGYTDTQLRGNADTSIFAGVTLGANLEETRKELMRLPFKEFKAKLDDITTKLKTGMLGGNPQIAAEFAKSMVGLSSDDVFLKSAVLPLDVAGLGLGKMAAKGGRKILENVGWVKEAEKAVKDVAAAAADPNVSKSTIEAAAGDLKESAVTRVVSNSVWEKIAGPKATEEAIEALSETFRADLSLIKSNPGKRGNDIVNRIVESSETITTSLFNAVKNISKVERLPEIMSNEIAVRAILDSIKNTYRGLTNSVIHMSKPYKEPVSNTYLTDMFLGNNDGTYFTSKTVAEKFAEFHGLKGSEILEGTDKAFTKDAVRKSKLEKNIADAESAIKKNEERIKDPNTSPEARAKAQEQIAPDGLPSHIEKFKSELDTINQKVTVEQQGFGYYIKITKPINETDDVVRKFIAETTNTKIPNSPLQQFLNGSVIGKLRTPEETLSLSERQNRLVATYTPSVYFDIMRQNAPTLNKVLGTRFGKGRNKRKEFERVLKNGQEIKDPDSLDDVGGYFFKSPAELEEKYLQWFKRLPDDDEIVAYFEFKRGMEIDRVFRNIAEHRNQQRVGAETHKITTVDEAGKAVASPEFSGVVRKKLSAVDDNILIMGDKLGDERMRSLQGMSVAERKELQKDIDNGSRTFIEVYAPENKPLAGFAGLKDSNRIRYVLAKTSEVRALDWNQIPRRGGGHMEHDYDYYIKQAKILHDDIGGRAWYEGDTTIMPIQVRAMGVKVAEHLNEVRKLLKAKDEDAAREYSNKNLHIDWDTVKGWFIGGPDATGKHKSARLSLNEPIHVIKKNESIIGIDKELERRYTGFKNGMKEGSLARQSQVEFSAQRDAPDMITLVDEGTRKNPLYKVAPAELVDPITTMNRGLARIAKSNFLDDYKTMSVEHWLKQASKYLEADDNQIWHAPFYYFNEAKFKTNAPAEIKSVLETSRLHTMQLTGMPSTTDAVLHSYAQRAYDTLYNNFGPKGLVIDPAWMLPKLKDPFGFVRSVVFNAKLGLFNVPQFIVQAGNYSNILGIAGAKYATPGTLGAQLHFWSTVNSNPAIIKHLDKLASKMNVPGASKWKLGEFEEAFREMHKTGFGNVGSEYAVLDNPMSDKIVEDAGRKFLDWGQYFFRQGERNAKYGAWYTAFKEFRDANPVGRITEADRAQILQRADLLNLNMSRASSSAIHQGVWSIPTQFYTYQIRLMELMTSGRISGKDKLRLFATNAALYGIPMAGGLSGLPVADYMRKKALENGYVVGDNFFSSLLMEGIPSMVGAVISGGGDFQKGTFTDVGSRFGTKGLEFLGGLDRSDKGYMDIVGGAAWSVAKSTIEQSDGFRRAMISMMKLDPEVFPLTTEDIVDVFKEITSINTAWRTYAAIQGGRWISKKEAYLADTTSAAAIFSAVSGLKDQRITDINTMANSLREQKDYETQVEKQFQQEFRRGALLMNDDSSQAHKFFTRAVAWLTLGGYPEDRISDLVNKAIRDNDSMLDKINFDFYIKRAPDARRDIGWDAMQRTQELKQKRGEQ